jgi:hypothetical protein
MWDSVLVCSVLLLVWSVILRVIKPAKSVISLQTGVSKDIRDGIQLKLDERRGMIETMRTAYDGEKNLDQQPVQALREIIAELMILRQRQDGWPVEDGKEVMFKTREILKVGVAVEKPKTKAAPYDGTQTDLLMAHLNFPEIDLSAFENKRPAPPPLDFEL